MTDARITVVVVDDHAVVRGDMAPIVIGAQSNIQDGTVVHVDEGVPCTVGARVGVGHRVVLGAAAPLAK